MPFGATPAESGTTGYYRYCLSDAADVSERERCQTGVRRLTLVQWEKGSDQGYK